MSNPHTTTSNTSRRSRITYGLGTRAVAIAVAVAVAIPMVWPGASKAAPTQMAPTSATASSVQSPSADPSAIATEIRKTLGERYGTKFPSVDEVRSSPIPGLWEVRIGAEIFYTDPHAHYVIQGSMIETASRRNLTQDRVDKLIAFDWNKFDFKDAIVWKNGSGARRMAVFADPHCGYCKKLERELANVPDVTVYTFMVPILGAESTKKARDIWCSKNRTTTWRNWMVDSTDPTEIGPNSPCDTSALDRNKALAQIHRVTGTPAIIFIDGSRAAGFMSPEALDKRLSETKR